MLLSFGRRVIAPIDWPYMRTSRTATFAIIRPHPVGMLAWGSLTALWRHVRWRYGSDEARSPPSLVSRKAPGLRDFEASFPCDSLPQEARLSLALVLRR